MADPPTTPIPPPPILPDPHRQTLHLPLIHGGAAAAAAPSSSTTPNTSLIREYRKGNWTIQETLILITAKKLDDERRLRSSGSTPQEPSKPGAACGSGRSSGELRWKWVENYCWNHGCLRSQNQCNDKWDNLLRDYKKVRDYESRAEASSSGDFPSYWTIDKHQRKERNLPSNMIFEVYQAISDVLQRKHAHRSSPQPPFSQPPPVALLTSSQPNLVTVIPAPPPPERSDSSSTEFSTEEDQDSESKRRKIRNLGSSIMRSASVLARALRSCEEKKEKRHREMLELEQRRLQIEERRNEVNRQGIANLVAAVTNLSGTIQSLISDRHTGQR
ncbi:trihelix transcription factor ASR3-like [Neltuma alba]|uniref:trihelix transcription factor ASR3-like n=1 Tax=Neltuma alba TaxID=207710 RepID=UPI0010A2E5F3|nr:trihelix transcription factor ASR3-like [Prosopis alba]